MISIIIPVFNAKKTLERCVNSVLYQNISDYEIILVDDGSLDGSTELCDSLSEYNSLIRTVHIPNGGIYQARKKGVEIANGDIITFLDADDWLDKDAYDYLLKEFYMKDVDMLLFTYKYENGTSIQHLYSEGVYHKEQIRKMIIPNMIWDIEMGTRRLDPSLCCKIVKKQLYLYATKDVDLRIVLGEDAAVTYPMICQANKLLIVNKAYYNYCVSNESSTRSFPVERIQEIKNFRSTLREKLSNMADFDFSAQIDCYTRTFLDMVSRDWFGCSRSSQMFVFPFDLIKNRESIVLYGAGDVGKSYYNSIVTMGLTLNGWYDKNAEALSQYNGEPIKNPESLLIAENDMILVAVKDEAVYKDIKSDLIGLGIRTGKIIWRKPVLIG